ncbi:protein RGF1 INDUCIBLE TRANSCRIPTION FACTOR 1-like [Primulina eburnea]|uniref:protein RGF1 INDUCIBLE TRANSCRIPTION FACTOR 1-like n=1 Tax=Primulina eburnea TaxID=1245227 RepID=UPI003C6C1D57
MARQITRAGREEEVAAAAAGAVELGGAAAAAPAWLLGLMAETFFYGCGVHQDRRKNEKNIFCLKCCQSFCPHCLPSHHPSHPLLQVRRYVYQDVIRLDDLEKLVDCSCIQAYTINSAKVIFLNQRAQSRSSSCKQLNCSGNTCFTCDRILQYPFNFCSLSCKVDRMVTRGEDLSSILFRFDESDFAISQFERLHMDGSDHEGQITPISILEFGGSHYDTGNAANSEGEPSGLVRRNPKTKRGFMSLVSLNNRRKGAPHRSPLS